MCYCKDESTGAFLPVAFADRLWMKWAKVSKGYVAPYPEKATGSGASGVQWVEYDDDGNRFAEFIEVSSVGNCRKCMTTIIYDSSGLTC